MFTIKKKESIIRIDEKRKSIRRRQTSECFHLFSSIQRLYQKQI